MWVIKGTIVSFDGDDRVLERGTLYIGDDGRLTQPEYTDCPSAGRPGLTAGGALGRDRGSCVPGVGKGPRSSREAWRRLCCRRWGVVCGAPGRGATATRCPVEPAGERGGG